MKSDIIVNYPDAPMLFLDFMPNFMPCISAAPLDAPVSGARYRLRNMTIKPLQGYRKDEGK